MYKHMQIVSIDGEDCGVIRRHSFSAVIFASQVAGVDIGGPDGVTIGQPVEITPDDAKNLIPVLTDLARTFYESGNPLNDEIGDIEHLRKVLERTGSCTLNYLP